MARIVNKDTAQKRWKKEMKWFASATARNEDLIYIHNHTNQYMCGTNEEFIQELNQWAEMEMNIQVYESNIKHLTWKGNKYIMITFNGDCLEGTDGDVLNEMAFALNFMVSGFTYLFKYEKYHEIKDEIRARTTWKPKGAK